MLETLIKLVGMGVKLVGMDAGVDDGCVLVWDRHQKILLIFHPRRAVEDDVWCAECYEDGDTAADMDFLRSHKSNIASDSRDVYRIAAWMRGVIAGLFDVVPF